MARLTKPSVWKKQPRPLPFPKAKRYHVIYADPPWDYGNQVQGAARNHYACMSLAQLKALPVADICEENCVLIMWCTWPKLVEGLQLMYAWGFTYKTRFKNWIKMKKDMSGVTNGPGWYVNGTDEFCLIGVKGKALKNANKHINIKSSLLCPRGKHSEKPESVREDIDRRWPSESHQKIELFSRRKPTAEWDVWGNDECLDEESDEEDNKRLNEIFI
jgi:N6-adenosine-specific RNA methylase IME4